MSRPKESMLTAHPYRAEDREACLTLFDGNTPRFFDAAEREEFVDYLQATAFEHAYQVIERDGRVVACGGHAIEPDRISVALCWDMVLRLD